MKMFGFNISVSRSDSSAPSQRSIGLSPREWVAGKDLDYPRLLGNAYQQVVWVYRAINVLAEQVANIPFLFSSGQRGRESLITRGPLLDLYNRPHPRINRFQYWELRIMWLMLRGECFRIPIYDDPVGTLSTASPITAPTQSTNPSIHQSTNPSPRRRKLARVLILDPAHFHHIIEDHRLIGWRYTG